MPQFNQSYKLSAPDRKIDDIISSLQQDYKNLKRYFQTNVRQYEELVQIYHHYREVGEFNQTNLSPSAKKQIKHRNEIAQQIQVVIDLMEGKVILAKCR